MTQSFLQEYKESLLKRHVLLQILRTLVLFFVCALPTSIMMIFQAHNDKRYASYLEENKLARFPLLDTVHSAFDGSKLAHLNDPTLCIFFFTTIVLAIYSFPGNRLRIIRRFAFIISLVYFTRIFTISLTVLPPADKSCELLLDSFMDLVFQGRSGFNACTDMLFSGHTATATLLMITWLLHAPRWIFKVYAVLHWLFCVFLFSTTRLHYTVDVMIGILISATYYAIYMNIYAFKELLEPKQLKPWHLLVSWIEGDDLLDEFSHSPLLPLCIVKTNEMDSIDE